MKLTFVVVPEIPKSFVFLSFDLGLVRGLLFLTQIVKSIENLRVRTSAASSALFLGACACGACSLEILLGTVA